MHMFRQSCPLDPVAHVFPARMPAKQGLEGVLDHVVTVPGGE